MLQNLLLVSCWSILMISVQSHIFHSLLLAHPPPIEGNKQTLFQVSGGTFLLRLLQLYTLLTMV
jgi:hypothetical protein